MSVLHCDGVGDFDAFSGKDGVKNDPAAVAMPGDGPLPPGRYYIVDRGSGGLFTHIRDFFMDFINHTDRGKWFALYRDDGNIDDWTFINGIGRGHFRLHPRGLANISEGCITLADPPAFYRLRARLLGATPLAIPGGKGFAYGTVDVQ
jgi:hypothetical protein|nr:DUF2778 domain-containing protein [Burkholderia sp. lig30]